MFKVLSVLAATLIVAGTTVATVTAPADAASSGGIMTRVEPFVGPPGPWCTSDKLSLRPWKNNVPNNPSSWDKVASSTDVTSGDLETVTHHYDGVTSYNEELECFAGSPSFYEVANTFDHRYEYVDYLDEGAGTAYIGSTYTAWVSGYIS
jgi:hypothetical protein